MYDCVIELIEDILKRIITRRRNIRYIEGTILRSNKINEAVAETLFNN